MTIKLTTCTRCGGDMYPCDTAPLYASEVSRDSDIGRIVPKICSGCRIDFAQEAREAKQAFYGGGEE